MLESHWTHRILAARTRSAMDMLRSFPYYSNYVDLVRMELSAISSLMPDRPFHKFAFLGSGPLPLSSLCIHDASIRWRDVCGHITSRNIDRDPVAISMSTDLCHKLRIASSDMSFECIDIGCANLTLVECDVIWLAALVGESVELRHEYILQVMRSMRPGALLVLRSAHSLRSLLYPVRRYLLYE